jgi:rare lipoprotein A
MELSLFAKASAMPWINDRFYANPLFGRALERARMANAGQVWSEQYPELGFQSAADQNLASSKPNQAPTSQTPGPSQPKQKGSIDRWVTIDGKHVLIHETKGGAKGLPDSGQASIYADRFEGLRTANNETFRQAGFTAALLPRSRWQVVPLGTRAKLTSGGQSVVVKINDRGAGDRVPGSTRTLDLSRAAAGALTGGQINNDKDARRVGLIHLDKIEIVPKETPLGPVRH